MANNLGDYSEVDIINYYLATTGTTVARPTAWWISLHTTTGSSETNAAWAATEITVASYARATIGGWVSATASLSSQITSNATATQFASIVTTSWGTVTSIGVWTSSGVGAGNLVFWADITPVIASIADTVTVAAGAVQLTLA